MSKMRLLVLRLWEAVKQNWKPILMLIIISPFMGEVLSGATSIFIFFSPGFFFPYVVLVYGFPALVVREVAMRRKLGPLGLMFLGVAYGLYHEGLFANTILYPLGSSMIDVFSNYGLIESIRIPWTLVITFWHGLYSVVFPIFIVQYLLPQKAKEQWLPLKVTWALGIFCMATATLSFSGIFGNRQIVNMNLRLIHFAFIIIAMLVIWFAAGKLPRFPRITSDQGGAFSLKPFLFGVLQYALVLIVPQLLAGLKISLVLFILYFIIFVILNIRIVSRISEATNKKAVLFVLGGETAQSLLFVVVGALSGDIILAVVSFVFLVVFITATIRLKRKTHS
ncbi:hypothetical protein [Lutispora sp.]|uniref:hypothetical protein n=1 Tax=Lutispora sp. TaxID=2828727 RepID=UPI002B1F27BC|nr:hypothetical protein [Lutispora sp.]MEA4963736.1 hypothetical protein [Lutispora sp.]